MSTKTTFKRVALVAVAALGLGVLSVAPSQASISGVTITVANGTATQTVSDTMTGAFVTVSNILLDNPRDTVTVQFIQKSIPSTAVSTQYAHLGLIETNTASGTKVLRGGINGSGVPAQIAGANKWSTLDDSVTAGTTAATDGYAIYRNTAGYAGAKFFLALDSITSPTAGVYTYTIVTKQYSYDGAATTVTTFNNDVSITVSASAAATALVSGTIDPSKTTAILNAGAPTTLSATDSSVAVVATAAATNHASIQVKTYTADSNPAPESVTATLTGAGVVCNSDGSICGKSLTIVGTAGDNTFRVRADGTAGTGSIVIATTTKTFPAKTVTFYAKSPSTITVSTNKPVIAVAAASAQTDVIRAVAKDANGNVWGGQLYSFAASAADALIASSATTPVACSFNSTYGYHECSVKGTAKGTANIKVMDASLDTDGTIATTDAAVTSSAATTRVSTGSATTVKLAFDKATYAPGEKAQIWVQVLDAEGLALPATTVSNALASGGITPSTAFSTGSATLTSTDVVIAGATDATVPSVAGYQVYTVYMPYSSGDVKITATGSTGVAAAGRVDVSATASVVNSSVDAATDAANEATDAANAATDAALAAADAADAATAAAQDASDAVAALSASVSKMIASLKAQITSLTNLVIKIQKKVRA